MGAPARKTLPSIDAIKDDIEALRLRIKRSAAEGRLEPAVLMLRRLYKGNDARGFERLGAVAHRQGRYDEAERRFEAALALEPGRVETLVLRARLRQDTSPPEVALAAWEEVLGRERNVEALERGGRICADLGRDDDAIAYLKEAIALEPTRVKAVKLLARLYGRRGDFLATQDLWRRLAEAGEREQSSLHLATLSQADDEEAVRLLKEASAANPSNPEPLEKLASLYERRGEKRKAELAWRRRLALGEDVVARDHIGAIMCEQSRFAEAIEHYRVATTLQPNVVRFWRQMARCLQETGALTEAVEAWRTVLDIRPDKAVHRQLGSLLLKLNRGKEAVGHLRAAADQGGSDRKARFRLATALEETGDIDAAETAWREAIKRDPNDIGARHRLAQLYYNTDRSAEAMNFLNGGETTLRPTEQPRPNVLERFLFGAGEAAEKKLLGTEGAVVEEVNAALAAMAADDRPVVVGPWLSELGFEVLYWIPFLRWAVREHGIRPERLTVVSRGGVKPWYESLGAGVQYRDIFSCIAPDEFRALNESRWSGTGLQKHMFVTDADNEILKRLNEDDGRHLLHPRLMYILFASYWAGRTGFHRYRAHVEVGRMQPISHPAVADLPANYVAAKFYSRPSFKENNAGRVLHLLTRLADEKPVVLLNTNLNPDDHGEFRPPAHPNIITIAERMSPTDNLLIQSAVISRAERVYCTYGGFAYLPLYYGVPVTSYFAEEKHHIHLHGPAAYWMAGKLGARLSIVDAASLD